MKHQFIARIAGIVSVCTVGVFSASAEGIGPLGHPNLFVNPDFESATVPSGNSGSQNGYWGYFKDNTVTLSGWTGGGNAGVASKNDRHTWLSPLSEDDNYRVFIQMQNEFVEGQSWIEQTVTPEKSGTYAFTCRYATRHVSTGGYGNPGTFGVSVACGGVTNVLANVAFQKNCFEYQNATCFLTLEAGQSYSFRLYGLADKTTDRTAMIGSCALERLPQPDLSITNEYHLAADEDWSGATVYLAPGTRVHLDGHNLKINGSVRLGVNNTDVVFTDTTANPGELRVTVPAGAEFVNYGYSIAGGIKFVKDGPGKYMWNGGTIAATVPITVTGGVFKVGMTNENVFGSSGTITVKDPGQFDINYVTGGKSGPLRSRTFYIEGDGPDGTGALVNNSYVPDAWGRYLNSVIMTGDATIGGNSRIDFRGSNIGIDGAGYTLTIKNTAMLAFCEGNAHLTCKDVVVADKGVFQPCSGCVLNIAEGVTLVDGGVFANWGTQSFNIPIKVSDGNGSIRSDNNFFTLNRPVTVETGKTLTIGSRGTWYSVVTNEADATIVMATGNSEFRDTGIFMNNGLVEQSAGELRFGSNQDASISCRVENYGAIRTTGGTFYLNAASAAVGSGVFDLGGTNDVSGNLSGFTGTLRVSGGRAALPRITATPSALSPAASAIRPSTAMISKRSLFSVTVTFHSPGLCF